MAHAYGIHAFDQPGFRANRRRRFIFAIILWSVTIRTRRLLHYALGIYGLLVGLAILVGLFAGGLDLELHGFRIITFAQSVWFIIAAILLWQSSAASPPAVAIA